MKSPEMERSMYTDRKLNWTFGAQHSQNYGADGGLLKNTNILHTPRPSPPFTAQECDGCGNLHAFRNRCFSGAEEESQHSLYYQKGPKEEEPSSRCPVLQEPMAQSYRNCSTQNQHHLNNSVTVYFHSETSNEPHQVKDQRKKLRGEISVKKVNTTCKE